LASNSNQVKKNLFSKRIFFQKVFLCGKKNVFLSVKLITMTQEDKSIHCGGVIVFNSLFEFIAVVSSDRGNYGFPKGKREKGETTFETALRELQEETGLQEKDIELQSKSVYFDEISNKGNICVRYFLARHKGSGSSNFQFVYDKTELNNVEWIHYSKLSSLLVLKNRPEILCKVVNFIKENNLI